MKYSINHIRTLRLTQKRSASIRMRVAVIIAGSLLLLAGAVGYSVVEVIAMNVVIDQEQQRYNLIETEYSKYQQTQMIINKEDIELLDGLQNNRIFWTKKLEAMASPLPENYWITRFDYTNGAFTVEGYGYISNKQEQLITLDDYLSILRKDTNFCDVFSVTRLNSTTRADENGKMRVSFDFTSNSNGAGQK
ncbi:MAG: hypothetical protein JW795_15145 [Chitinivibrionales bacterium]|nr:hypothetical protein [Chitinivibrionales bacterium]